MEGLIISFIKLNLFNQIYQTFRSLYTLIFNLDLNLNFKLMDSSFISSPIHFFHDFRPSLYKQKYLYIQSSQVQTYVFIKSRYHQSRYQRLLISNQCSDFHKVYYHDYYIDKAEICTKEKFQLRPASFSSLIPPRLNWQDHQLIISCLLKRIYVKRCYFIY